MIHLNFAPSADMLLEPFIDSLRANWMDPFESPTVLVPNPALGKWLDLRLADSAHGFQCHMGLNRTTLERYLRDVLAQGMDTESLPGVLDTTTLAQILCPLLEQCEEKAVKKYLSDSHGKIDPNRKVQLAQQLAVLLLEYEFNRPAVWNSNENVWGKAGVEQRWEVGKDYFGGTLHESWQRELYTKAREAIGDTLVSLPQLHRLRRDRQLQGKGDWAIQPGHLYLFQVAKISHFHRNILIEISQMPGVEIHVFLTNPCAEYWEDVKNRKSTSWKWKSSDNIDKQGIRKREEGEYAFKSIEDFGLPADQTLLKLWGDTGKENIHLWFPATDWDCDFLRPDWVDDDVQPQNLLKAIQKSLLRREDSLPARYDQGKWPCDESLKILAAPDPVREVETLRLNILQILEQGKGNSMPYRLEDIVVYLPDPATYLSAIEGVFGAYYSNDPRYIPYNILGVPGSDSLFAQAVNALLSLVQGEFDRATIFRFLRNPIVALCQGYHAEDVIVWERWADNLGIFRGFDSKHREQMGDRGGFITYEHTFEWGLSRLLLGNLITEPIDLGHADLVSGYRDLETGDARRVETFVRLIRQLHEHTVVSLQEQRGPSEWVSWAKDLLKFWIPTIPEKLKTGRSAEARLHRDYLNSLRVLEWQETLGKVSQISLEECLAHLKNLLPGELPAESRAWVGGVTFAPLRQGMVLPHRVVFVLGLDAKAYPGTRDDAAFNLLTVSRIIGDSDSVRGNRFTFLELLHAAREKLVLSYRARNMQKEEVLQPSSVILELENWLKGQVQGELCKSLAWIPWEKSPLDELEFWSKRSVALASLPNSRRYKLRYQPEPPVQRNGDIPEKVFLTNWKLQTWWANPLEYHLRSRLNILDEDDAGTLSATDEPLSMENRYQAVVRKNLWIYALSLCFVKDGKGASDCDEMVRELDQQLNEEMRKARTQGLCPEAQLASMLIAEIRKWLPKISSGALQLREEYPNHVLVCDTDFSLGYVGRPATLERKLKSDLIADKVLNVSISTRHGAVLVPSDDKGEVLLIEIAKVPKKKELTDGRHKLWLNVVLQQLALGVENSPVSGLVLDRNSGEWAKMPFKPCADNQENWTLVQTWLNERLLEMVLFEPAEHLPLTAVEKTVKSKDEVKWDLLTSHDLQASLEDERNPSYRCYLDAFGLVDAEVPHNEQQLYDLAKKRFAPYLEGMIHG